MCPWRFKENQQAWYEKSQPQGTTPKNRGTIKRKQQENLIKIKGD